MKESKKKINILLTLKFEYLALLLKEIYEVLKMIRTI